MRKIEQEMLDAIEGGYDWHKDNTSVYPYEHMRRSEVFLHGNHIATVHHVPCDSGGVIVTGVEVNKETLARWPTPTTKSRLRALGVDVYTKKGITYVDGEAI